VRQLPNILTTARFFLAFVMVWFIFAGNGGQARWALFIFLIASFSDYWDGRIARKYNLISEYGALMDPIADKALTLSAFVSFWKLDLVPGLWVAIVAAREILMTGFRLFRLGQGKAEASKKSGKFKTALQMLYISGVLAYLAAWESDLWVDGWEPWAMGWTRYGMLVIVVITLWSGVETLLAKKKT
jgi:CDP-diacylglycerol---glycerol-3-phosphate 3-phosphatidyltransferase